MKRQTSVMVSFWRTLITLICSSTHFRWACGLQKRHRKLVNKYHPGYSIVHCSQITARHKKSSLNISLTAWYRYRNTSSGLNENYLYLIPFVIHFIDIFIHNYRPSHILYLTYHHECKYKLNAAGKPISIWRFTNVPWIHEQLNHDRLPLYEQWYAFHCFRVSYNHNIISNCLGITWKQCH